MSQQRKRQPKPFLKKGTRQYLSNAQVRSQSDKPKVVEFADQNSEFSPPKINNRFEAPEEDIVIPIKAKTGKFTKPPPQSKPFNPPQKSKENKIINQQKPPIPNQNSNKKRSAVLQDYISGGKKETIKRSDSKQRQLQNQMKDHSKQKRMAPKSIPTKSTMANQLKMQMEEPESDEESMPIKIQKRVQAKIAKKNQIIPNNSECSEKINIISDNSDGEQANHQQINRYAKPSIRQAQFAKNKLLNQNNWNQSEDQNDAAPVPPTQPKTTSKILEKYYKKAPIIENKTDESKSTHQSKLTINDIPAQLKNQIFTQEIENRKETLSKKVQELKSEIAKAQKVREKYEADQKQLNAERQSFQKQMEEKNKQFAQKLKSQNQKLNRQKRYMKDIQLAGKGDWKTKNQVEQLKKSLQQANAQKKRIEVKLKGEIDRLKKRLDEQIQNSKNLSSQIKYLQVDRVMQKQTHKQKVKQVEAAIKRNSWTDAPSKSYVSRFLQDNFTLLSLSQQHYHYQSIEYYKYYKSHQNNTDQCELLSEKISQNKIYRKYKNGKQEIEYISKAIKQIFPYNFSVVSFQNDDTKLQLPEGITVYYDSRNNIIEFTVTPSKKIYNFLNDDQIEMKVYSGSNLILHQTLKDGVLIRQDPKGKSQFKTDPFGKVVKIK